METRAYAAERYVSMSCIGAESEGRRKVAKGGGAGGPRSWVLLGVGVVATGTALVYQWRRAQAERASSAAAVADVAELRREVGQLHGLAANEAALYLRGYIDGRAKGSS